MRPSTWLHALNCVCVSLCVCVCVCVCVSKVLSMKDKKTQAQDRRRITAHFIPLLPQLLAKVLIQPG